MEQSTDTPEMLDLMIQPGFFVKNGQIVKLNQAAQGLLLSLGEDIDPHLCTGREEYAAFQGGCLSLTLTILGQNFPAFITRMGDLDVFLLEQDEDQTELQAMALAARELREPLFNVMLTAERLFPMAALTDDPNTRDQVARLNRGLMQMLRVISNMSDANQHSTGAPAHPEIRDVSAFMKEIFHKAADLAASVDISLQYTGPDGPVFSLIDSQMLERAVLNILSNAVKFTPKGGWIKAKLAQQGSRLILSVQDNGQGIADNIRTSLFRRYQRQPMLEESRFGIGLGMVLIRAAAAHHGGAVLIDQPDNVGTRVTLTLAIRQDTDLRTRTTVLNIDYAGERDHALMELSDSLPASAFDIRK